MSPELARPGRLRRRSNFVRFLRAFCRAGEVAGTGKNDPQRNSHPTQGRAKANVRRRLASFARH
jgi:hypothetical protein